MANMYITAQVIGKITLNIVQQNYKFNVIIFETNFVIYKCLQIFPANTDVTTVVVNQLPTPVTALCLRLYIVARNEWADLKMEVYGCLSV